MPDQQLTLVTTTYNCLAEMPGYFAAFAKLDSRLFDWIVIDAGSTDGTAEFLAARAHHFAHFVSEPDEGFYFGLNKAVDRVKTPYYMVFGADDRPSANLLEHVLPLLGTGASLILGSVRLMPNGIVKRPGARWWHRFIMSKAISHHSVGTVIRTDVHLRHGRYDTHFALLADGLLVKRILKSQEPLRRVDAVFGDFMLGGMSTKQEVRSMAEIFLIQVSEGSGAILQLLLLALRVAKFEARKVVRALGSHATGGRKLPKGHKKP